MKSLQRIRLLRTRRFRVADELIELPEGAIVDVCEYDSSRRKVLLQFSNGQSDWFHHAIVFADFELDDTAEPMSSFTKGH